MMLRRHITQAIAAELDRAYAKHGSLQWGRHEFYAILKEEVDELWDAIKADAPIDDVRKEALQVAAMVFRYLETGDRYQPATIDSFPFVCPKCGTRIANPDLLGNPGHCPRCNTILEHKPSEAA